MTNESGSDVSIWGSRRVASDQFSVTDVDQSVGLRGKKMAPGCQCLHRGGAMNSHRGETHEEFSTVLDKLVDEFAREPQRNPLLSALARAIDIGTPGRATHS